MFLTCCLPSTEFSKTFKNQSWQIFQKLILSIQKYTEETVFCELLSLHCIRLSKYLDSNVLITFGRDPKENNQIERARDISHFRYNVKCNGKTLCNLNVTFGCL